MRSIRSRLTLMLVIGMGSLLIGAGLLSRSVLQAFLLAEFNQVLLGKVEGLKALIEDEGDAIEFDFSEEMMPSFSRSYQPGAPSEEQPEYFQLWLPSEQRIEKSISLSSDSLTQLSRLGAEPIYHDTELQNGHRVRVVQVIFTPKMEELDEPDEREDKDNGLLEADNQDGHAQSSPDRLATLIVARDRTRLDEHIATFDLYFAGLTIALLVIMAVLVRLALRTGLRPLDDVCQQASQLDVDSLTTGIQQHTETAELMPVVSQINALLHRLDAAFSRERQFSSDVAHELRTPLAELRMLTEVGGRWPEDRDAVEQYFADAHGICEQMERVVISLLTLTRCERGVQPVQMTPIHLRKIVETSWQSVKQTATEKSQRFEYDIHSSYTMTSDYDMLFMVLSNLLGNAVLHSGPSSVIRCVAAQNGRATYLTISNPVKDLAEEDLNHIFERFWRKDTARSDGGHSGLGLAIVKAFSDLLNFEIQAHLDEEQMFSVRLSLSAPPA